MLTSITINLSSRSLLGPIITISREQPQGYFCKILHILLASKCISETLKISSGGVGTIRQQNSRLMHFLLTEDLAVANLLLTKLLVNGKKEY
jgi:hypothetical protein